MKTAQRTKDRTKVLAMSFLSGALIATASWGVIAVAQETIASVGAATAMGTTLGAAAGSGMMTPGGARNRGGGERERLIQEAGDAGAPGGGGGAAAPAGAGDATVSVRVTTGQPLRWGPDSGDDIVRQLLGSGGRYPAQGARRRTSRGQARYAQRLSRLTPRQRSRMIHAQYQKPAVGYLSWYLKEDRYKVTSKVWQFVTTPNDRFYYRPWAPAMRLRNPSRVIGFHTWQDAMIAGYRPDPVTRPEPGPQLAYLATLTRGPMLSTYVEYIYSGQVTPQNFSRNLDYIRYVAGEVGRHRHTRHLVGSTVEQVLGAIMGRNHYPRYVGGTPTAATTEVSADVAPAGVAPGAAATPAAAPEAASTGAGEKRGEDYDQFRSNAGNLARKPGG